MLEYEEALTLDYVFKSVFLVFAMFAHVMIVMMLAVLFPLSGFELNQRMPVTQQRHS